MKHPRICAVITSNDAENIKSATSMADLFEVRIDLIGPGWKDIPRLLLKPWIATNRPISEGGKWRGGEDERKQALLKAVQLGAAMVDVELSTPGLEVFVTEIKKSADCIISFHDFHGTPGPDILKTTVLDEIRAGADICKIVTTAATISDNLTVLRLIKDFPDVKMVALAMGEAGQLSRLICPLAGGAFTFVMIEKEGGSAPGQMLIDDLFRLYGVMGYD